MFERFTEASRRTLFFARLEASDSGSSLITPENLLLGVLREPQGQIAAILAVARITLADVRQKILKRQPAGKKIPTSVEIPFSPETKRALIYATEETDRLRHFEIGPEHLLLGLLREEGTIAQSILEESALTLENVRDALSRAYEERTATESSESPATEIDRLARMVEQLGAEMDEFRRSLLVDAINQRLDALKRRIEPTQGENR
jgi:ATP-dependent Clp protease ATP-binding subunit ClpA